MKNLRQRITIFVDKKTQVVTIGVTQEQSSQPLIQSRLTLKHGEKALDKSRNAVFLKTKTMICNRPSQNRLSREKN